jgi:FKBP-type peptidyl-prolyl cis-trans isomerase
MRPCAIVVDCLADSAEELTWIAMTIYREITIRVCVIILVKGWTKALQFMKVGTKLKLHVPAELAYGEQGAGGAIGPHSTLIFDVVLLDIIA